MPRKAVSTKETEVGVSETMAAAKLSTHQWRGLDAPHLRGAGAEGHASRPRSGPAAHVPDAPRVTSKAAKSQRGYFVTGTQMTRLRRKRWKQWLSGSWAGMAAEAHEWVEPSAQPTRVPWQGRGKHVGGRRCEGCGQTSLFIHSPRHIWNYPAFQFLPIICVYKVASHCYLLSVLSAHFYSWLLDVFEYVM